MKSGAPVCEEELGLLRRILYTLSKGRIVHKPKHKSSRGTSNG